MIYTFLFVSLGEDFKFVPALLGGGFIARLPARYTQPQYKIPTGSTIEIEH